MTFSRKKILSEVANAALFGNLGFFVGTGFSKALTAGDAPSFGELLQAVSSDLNLDFDFDDIEILRGKSYPRIAQEMVGRIIERYYQEADSREKALRRATTKLKRSVCKQCDLRADLDIANQFREIMKDIPIQWVITTNYDFLLEDIIPNSIYLLPDQLMNVRHDYVPIYHLHGHIRSPLSLIITENDYVKLLSPTEYRQLKLNLLLAESTTIMLGYSLGDVNVQSAIEWSRSFKKEKGLRTESYQSLVIQALYVSGEHNEDPCLGYNGEVIIEIPDIPTFLHEIKNAINEKRNEHEASRQLLQEWLDEERSASTIADNPEARAEFIEAIERFPRSYDVQMLITFLRAVLDPIWAEARQDGGFEHYDRFLQVLLDIIENIPVANTHPSLFAYLAERLDDVAYYMEPDGTRSYGTSWSASQTWLSRRDSIPIKMKRELLRYAKRHHMYRLQVLLDED